ncbi:MAG: polysaccharide biosynthesis/export family protein [Fibrobacterota bacterium]|nr:polysaccharide biosynthesis/export family protein [Fibrobacterota bacterium]
MTSSFSKLLEFRVTPWAMPILLAMLTFPSAQAASLVTAPRGERFTAGQALTVEIPLDSAGLIRGGYPIDTAGYVDFPIVGRVLVHGRTQEEVETFLGEKLANYLKDTHVKVSPAFRLTMLGYWAKQGQYYVPPNTTVWEAARMAGGIGGERTLCDIKVLRGSTETDIAFLDEYSQGRTLVQAGFQSGDIIMVPVPRDNTGAWYWFRESLSITAQIAGIASTLITLYITYELLKDQKSSN